MLALAAATLYVAYAIVYPRWAGADMKRLALYDLGFTVVVVAVTGALYAQSHPTFSLLGVRLPWWAYAVLAYGLLEIPLFVAYARKASSADDDPASHGE